MTESALLEAFLAALKQVPALAVLAAVVWLFIKERRDTITLLVEEQHVHGAHLEHIARECHTVQRESTAALRANTQAIADLRTGLDAMREVIRMSRGPQRG